MIQWLILHTVESTALAVVVWLLCGGLRPRPAVRHALWLVVLAKLLTPPLVRWPWALPALLPSPTAVTVALPPAAVTAAPVEETPSLAPAPAPAPTVEDVPDAKEEVVVRRLPVHVPAVETESPSPEPEEAPARSWILDITEWIWFGGACVAGLVQLARVVRLRGRLKRGLPAPAWLEALTADAAGVLKVRPPRVLVLPGVSSPMVCALDGPRLIWPMGLEDRLPADGRRAVLLHELAHLRRRDHWVGWLLLVGGCVWWWHPLFALVRRRLGREAELACDARVVEAMPGARRAYAEALLEVSQRPSAMAAPILGAASGRRELERRLVMIMRGSGSGRLSWRALVGVGVLGLLALPAWSLGGGDSPKPEAPSAAPAAEPPTTVAEPTPANKTPAAGNQHAPTFGAGFVDIGTVAANPPDANDRDKKIQELEAKIKELQDELVVLHARTSTAVRTPTGSPTAELEPAAATPSGFGNFALPAGPAPRENAEVSLTRVTYKLPAGHAEATAAFLSQHVEAPVLEAKADGDSVIVTTTPEAQKVIRMFIALVQAKPAMPTMPTTGPGPANLPPESGPPQIPSGASTTPLPTAPPTEAPRSVPRATADLPSDGPAATPATGGEPVKK